MKIAVVDDEEIWRRKATKVIKEYLQEEATIRTYSSGDALLEENEEYKIVVLDVEMQGKDGFDTALEYKVSYPD